MKNLIFNEVKTTEATPDYAFGFTFESEKGVKPDSQVYACLVRNGLEVAYTSLKLDTTASGTYASGKKSARLTFRPNLTEKEKIASQSEKVIALCTYQELREVATQVCPKQPNNGRAFEIILAKYLNGKRNASETLDYTQGGDIEVNGEQWQAKYLKATIKAIGID